MKIKRFIRRIKHSRRKTSVFSLVLIILIFGLTLGYAYVQTTLKVDGTVNVSSANWNVYWDNIVVGDLSNAEVTSSPTISSGKTEVTFGVTLNNPGDRYVFTVDAVNDGTIDAMISNIEGGVYETDGITSKPLPDYLAYTFTYQDGTDIEDHHLLETGKRETYRISVYYKEGFDTSELPTEDTDYVFKFGTGYVQKSASGVQRVESPYSYTVSEVQSSIGSAIPNDVITYSNYQDAVLDFGQNVFLRHRLENNIITESYAGFLYQGKAYYVRGGGATYNSGTGEYNNDSPYYEENKALLLSIFGSDKCSERTGSGSWKIYECRDGNLSVSTSTSGYASVDETREAVYHYVCSVDSACSSCDVSYLG